MTIYFTAGGLMGTAWVNALQLVVEPALIGIGASALACFFAAQARGRRT
jgi:hypothetical protein